MTLEELQITFVQYEATHVAGASMVRECMDCVFQPFGLPPSQRSGELYHRVVYD